MYASNKPDINEKLKSKNQKLRTMIANKKIGEDVSFNDDKFKQIRRAEIGDKVDEMLQTLQPRSNKPTKLDK